MASGGEVGGVVGPGVSVLRGQVLLAAEGLEVTHGAVRDAEVGFSLVGQALQHLFDVADVFMVFGAIVIGQLGPCSQ